MTVIRIQKSVVNKYFWNWNDYIKKKTKAIKYIQKIFRLDNHLFIRKYLKLWLHFGQSANKNKFENAITGLKTEKKVLRREMTQAKNEFEAVIFEKETRINQFVVSEEKFKKIIEKILESAKKRRNNCVLLTKSQVAFRY